MICIINFSLSACNMVGTENKVKVIDREKPEYRGVAKINFLHNGSLCDVSVDGTEFLFYSHKDMGCDNYLYRMDLISKECNQLTQIDGIIEYHAKYSPDSCKIAVSALSKDIRRCLPNMIIDMDNSDISPIVCNQNSAIFENTPINWSLEGKHILTSGWNKKNDLMVIHNSDGKEIGCLDWISSYKVNNDTKTFNRQLACFFDQSRVIYNIGERIVSRDINKLNQVPEDIVEGSDFVVSPDKKYIAYLSQEDTQKRHLKIDLLGSDMKVLYTAEEVDLISTIPVFKWANDSKSITYYSENAIWNLNIETKEKVQLTTDMGIVKELYWVNNNCFVFETFKNDKSEIYQVEFENNPKVRTTPAKNADILKINEKIKVLQNEAANEFEENIIKVFASSELGEDYSVKNLVDRNPATAWVEGKSGMGEGDYIEFELDDITLNRIGIINGYKKSEYLYNANSRVKKVRLEVDSIVKNIDTGEFESVDHIEKFVEFSDRGFYDGNTDLLFHCTDFKNIDKNSTRLVRKIKFTILEVYKGYKYDDTCISEVIIIGKNMNKVTPKNFSVVSSKN